jgi:hypothetical protein
MHWKGFIKKMKVHKYCTGVLCLTAINTLATAISDAQAIVYSNTTNFTGSAFSNGNATNVAGNTVTNVVADKITFSPSFSGLNVTDFAFNITNLNALAVSARPRVRFWQTNGAGGAPGTLITGFSFDPISFSPGVANTYTTTIGPGFVLPASGDLWAGITFDNNTGATGATIADLNNLGQGIFDSPTVGSSDDSHWVSAGAGSNLVSNPAGAITISPFGAAPIANYGWSFAVAAPEPRTLALFVVGGVGFVARRRR